MKMFIHGEERDSRDSAVIEVVNPYNGKLLDTVPAATREDVTECITWAVEGQKTWNQKNIREKSEVLKKFVGLVKEKREDLARLLTMETGKPIGDSYGEVDELCYIFEGSIEVMKHHYGKTMPRGTQPGYDTDLQVTVYEPRGVIVCIIPFNFPLALWAYKSGPALMAGNSIITKPASANPLSVMTVCKLLAKAGVPADACQCVTGSGSKVGDWLVDDSRIAQVNMTGSVQAGLSIAKTAAKYLTDYKFELGGNDPFIVLEDADMDLAVREAVDRTRNAGQCCSGSKRFIIHNSRKEEFVRRLIDEVLEKVVMGDPLEAGTTMGTLVSEEAAKGVEQEIAHTVAQGAKLIYGGERKGAAIKPAVLVDVTKEMDIARDMEVFGPVYPIIGFDTVEEAIEIAESTDYGLGSGVITNDLKKAMKVVSALRAGHVAVNGAGSFRAVELPFGGGKKNSGNSRECLSSVLEEVMQVKSIVFRYAMEEV